MHVLGGLEITVEATNAEREGARASIADTEQPQFS